MGDPEHLRDLASGVRSDVYRLRAIGHLFEAEDESQEWPELHAAIRDARKAYQADGTMPTWDTLAEKARQPQ
jgi:predicted alpha/beta hydrolase family esterase